MRSNSQYALESTDALRDLMQSSPWCTFVTATARGVVASHYPVILDENADGIVLLSHMGRPDEEKHELGSHEMLAIVQGPHGYISPSWYGVDRAVPTWNFVTAHVYGTPQVLTDDENLETLANLVARFEDVLPQPFRLDVSPANDAYARAAVRGTVGFRLPVARIEAKEKMSQDKPPEVVDRIIDELDGVGPYANPALAAYMRAMRRGDFLRPGPS
jgi:transcriptional regulator